jgi:hypothetical protein
VRGARQVANRICCRLRGRTEGLRDRPGALRENVSPQANQATALAFRTLLDFLADHEEGWIVPYLMEGFADERETAGMDVLARWTSQLV